MTQSFNQGEMIKISQLKDYNVNGFGIFSNEEKLVTSSLQKMIDEVSLSGGGNVIFPKGKYVLSTVYLKSNISIVLEKDCVILGSNNFDDYDDIEKVDYPIYQDVSHTYFNCSMFVAKNCENVSVVGEGTIDMRSVWDVEEKNKSWGRRGAKCIAFKECANVLIQGVKILNATDLAIYLAGCDNVETANLFLRVHIDGISPDSCDNVYIHDCYIESGDDSIVFKTSYTLNRLKACENVVVKNCVISSQCNALKFGTETNYTFRNFDISNIEIKNTRSAGIAIESVDGSVVENVKIKNVKMKNVNAPLFIQLGERLRAPKGTKIGSIKNIEIENVTATGEYFAFNGVALDYDSFISGGKTGYFWQDFKTVYDGWGLYETTESKNAWQISSNMCGRVGHPIENITLKDIYLEVDGNVDKPVSAIPEEPYDVYPDVVNYARILPASGIYFRHVKGLTLKNVKVKTLNKDIRQNFVFDDVENLVIE